jgi:hypothetical protein
MIIYLESTINLLFSSGQKIEVDNLIKNSEVKQIEIEGKEPIKYLKING